MMVLALLPLGAALWLGLGEQQWWPLVALLTMSLLTVAAYAWDKRQAVRGEWRIPESRLHLLELCGGWPGALVARQWLRHKTQKRSYRLVFWFIVLLHLTLWGLWLGRPLWQQ
ncbi:DUF1294 domain-containing protein [Aeromonas veronii]|uniref:DUF1294 domain-containing protein n=1 Tax=Aeromonas veronii TaxID=654 RepID=UPI001FD6C2A8|nr:DUF1294 domain-containing protein [Aeromonas veronii]MCJ8215276.1 DUF1294 domain-containing protein [Aeromonas veronii]USP57903.1 DUF1294 domain-containing protein [Aeromonas veronii]